MWLFYYFDFEKNHDVFKSKSPSILLNKTVNFNKNDTYYEVDNSSYVLSEASVVFQLI